MKININSSINKINPILWQFLCLGVSSGAFALVLQNHQPHILRELGIASRVDFFPVIPILALFIYICFRISGRIGEVIALMSAMVLFALPLAGLWASGHTQTSVIGGLIQLNDASGYYIDSLRLANGELFSFFSSRRPLFPGFLSILLVFTNYNLMAALAILSAITAISCYLLTREIQRTHGTEIAIFLLMMIFLYYRLHSGISMSENFGIAIGSLGFALLWRGAGEKNLSLIWLGIFTTTIALNARAGAFFVLPFLILWIGITFYEDKVIPWKPIGMATTAIIMGFASNLALGRMIGQPNGIPFANFSYTLYSLAEGGKSWAYIAETHPEVLLIPEPERTKRIFQLAFEIIQAKPGQTVTGAIFFWKAIFTDTLYNVFAFVAKDNWVINPVVKWLLYILSLTGILSGLYDIKNGFSSLIILSAIGIFLSIPLAPPTDSFRMRPYAASIAMISILPAYGLGFLLKKLTGVAQVKNTAINWSSSRTTPTFTIFLLLIILIGPPIIKSMTTKPRIILQNCASETNQVVIQFSKGTYINIRKNKDEFTDWAPDYHIYLFRKNVHAIENENLINWLETIPASQTLLVAMDIPTGRRIIISMPSEMVPQTMPEYYQICGRFEDNPNLINYDVFYGSEVLSIK